MDNNSQQTNKYGGLSTVGPEVTRSACDMQPTMRIARGCTALLLPRELPLGRTGGRTDGHDTVLTRSPHNNAD